jgi:PAS domain S-box-containing protein
MTRARPPLALSLRSYLIVLIVAAQVPLASLVAVLALRHAAPTPAWIPVAGVLLLAGIVLATLVARRLATATGELRAAVRAVAHGDEPETAAAAIHELDELAETIEASGRVRREVEGRLRATESRLAAMLGGAPASMLVIDGSGRVAMFNRAAEELFGCSGGTATGRPADRFLSPRCLRLVEAHLDEAHGRLRALAASDEANDYRGIRGDGTEFAASVQVARVETAAGPVGMVVVRDVSEERRRDEERLELLRHAHAAQSEAEQAAQQSWLLAETSRMLALSIDDRTTLAGVARLLAGTLADWCALDVVDEDGDIRRIALAHADPAREPAARALGARVVSRTELPESLARVLSERKAEILAEIADDGRLDLARGEDQARLVRALGARSALLVPLLAGERALGVLTLVRATGAPYASADLAIARELAGRAAIAVAQGRQYRSAEEARTRHASLVAALGGIVWEAQAATLEIVRVNQQAETLLGYPLEQWRRPGFLASLLHPDDRDAAVTTLRAGIAAGRGATLECRVSTADGRVLWMEHRVQPLHSEEGAVVRVQGLMLDVTPRRREAEERERLLAAERVARADAEAAAQRARFLAEASDLLTSSLDHGATLDSLARLAVPAFADWCLVHLSEAVGGRRVHAAGGPDDGTDLAGALERLAPAIELRALLTMIDRVKDRQPLLLADVGSAWLEGLQLLQQLAPRSIIVVPMVARGRPIGTLTFIATRAERRYGEADLALARDLAQRAANAVDNARVYAEAEGANRAKDQFLATLSHELRTPLTAMLGWVLMLQSGRLSGDAAAAALASIERNTRVQTQLINDLLDISRIVAGKLQLERRPVDLRVVIGHALDSVRRAAESKRLTVGCAIVPEAAWVPGDAVRLEQVLVNLLGNAVKFTPEGGHIEVQLDAEDALARLTVTDTGQGIEPAVLPHVFDSFRQADSSSTRRHGGLGLGLAIVRRLVDMHHGQVAAFSAGKDRGATFVVRLPRLPEAERPTSSPAETRRARQEAGLPRLDRVRALVVDDDDDSRRFVETVLTASGAEVRVAGSVDAALEVLDTTYVDVLVSDIGMPGSDGYDLIARLRTREREHGGRIPAVALTAYASEEDRDRALAAGFSAHVPKPVSPGALARAVADAVGRPALI